MNELRAIAQDAYINSQCKSAINIDPIKEKDGYFDSPRMTKTRDHILKDLLGFEMRLKKVALLFENPKLKKELLLAAQWSSMYFHTISKNRDVGPMTYWYQMTQIHAVAIRCLQELTAEITNKKVETLAISFKEEKPTVVTMLKELQATIFDTLQDENLLAENALCTEIGGNNVDAEMSLVWSCEEYFASLPADKYKNSIALWRVFRGIKIRNTIERMNTIDSIIESIITVRMNEAIITRNKQKLLHIMRSPFMEEMIPSKKIEILQLAIDQKSTEVLEKLTDSDWFSDLALEEMNQLIAYAEKKDQTPHVGIIQKSAGYMYYGKN